MQKSRIKNYSEAASKIQIINDLLIRPEECRRIVGLAGPNPVECIQRWMAKGFHHITTYERDLDVFLRQERMLSKKFPDVNMVLGDITKSYIVGNTFYDLDFCCSVRSLPDLSVFIEPFMATVTLRAGRGHKGENRDFVEQYFFEEVRGEKIENWNLTDYTYDKGIYSIGAIKSAKAPRCQREIHTNKGSYLTTSYRDTAPMLNIVKTI